MGKNIIIAEKPSVGIEYAKILGVPVSGHNGYFENERWIVTWTIGHLITMSYPEKYDDSLKEWKLETIPFIPSKYQYEVIEENRRQFEIVKRLYNRNDISAIYYAGDSGREGLYIQMLVRQFAGHCPGISEKVVWIDSQTEEEVLRGIAEAKDLSYYMPLQDSGYMRAIEDFIGGINFSRLLSVKYAVMLNSGSGQKKHKPISVGRVMTCVLGMVVRREREIRNFKVTNFYRVAGVLDIDGNSVECEWRVTEKSRYFQSPKLYSEFGFLHKNDAKEFIENLGSRLNIEKVTKSIERKNAPLLFSMPELQGECTKRFHISPSETLKIAQSLYENKYITYPRTDARVLSSAVAKEISKNLKGLAQSEYGKYVDEIMINHWSIGGKYVDDSKITDHYAIIPTGKVPMDLSGKNAAVYDLICRRFLAIFYPPAEYERIKFEANSGTEKFYGTSKYLLVPGYYKASGLPQEESASKSNVDAISRLKEHSTYEVLFEMRKGETTPPKRYTSGSMILAMENAGSLIEDDELREQIKKNGIGTSATRDGVIEKLIHLNYLVLNEKTQILHPSNFGEMVYEVVDATVPSMLSPEITAQWEKGLEQISTGEISKSSYESDFYKYVREECEKIKRMDNLEEIRKRIRPYATSKIEYVYKEFDPYNTKILCPLCGDEVETTKWGFKCSSNKSKTEGCSFAIGDILGHRLLTPELAVLLKYGKVGPFFDFVTQKGKPFGAYLLWNDEEKKVQFEMAEMPWEKTELKCPICGKFVLKREGFFKCTDYEDKENGCSFWLGKVKGKLIPEKQIEKLLKDGQTDLLKGFKSEDSKFDAFLVWSQSEKRIRFKFPTNEDLITKYRCPNCGGRIISTPYGYKCENYVKQEERTNNDCMFYAGTILGHTIKEKELDVITKGGQTDLVSLKNSEKKCFSARLYWNQVEKRISFKFDENEEVQLNLLCPICNSPILKNRYEYRCSKHISKDDGCRFHIGSIAGVFIDETQLKKLLQYKKTDLIVGFKPKEKGKKPFSAFLIWDDNQIKFEFSNQRAQKEISNYLCPSCKAKKLYKTAYGYVCDCGFKLNLIIAEKEIPEEQIKKLLLRGVSDVIDGFYSARLRKKFSAKLFVNDKKVDFSFPNDNGNGR